MTDSGEVVFEMRIGKTLNLSRGNCPHCGKEIVVGLRKPKDEAGTVTPIGQTKPPSSS